LLLVCCSFALRRLGHPAESFARVGTEAALSERLAVGSNDF